MDLSDRESSGVPSPSSSNGSRDPPNCGRCRNHGVIKPLKGHKKDCKFRDCMCNSCVLGLRRRDIMARQNALAKQQKLQVEPRSCGLDIAAVGESDSMSSEVDVASAANSRLVCDLEVHSRAANDLLSIYSLHVNALPFAYAVMSVAGDLHTACNLINQAQNELPPRRLSGEVDLQRAGPSAFSHVAQQRRSPPYVEGGNDVNGNYPIMAHHHRQDAPLPLVTHAYDLSRGPGSREGFRRYSGDSSPSPPHY